MDEAAAAMEAGHGARMMLEMDPGRVFAVLSPAFKGNEQGFAAEEFSNEGCTFLTDAHCELHETAYLPLECAFCHHDRPGQGERCHAEIAKQWNSAAGRALVVRWSNETEFWRRLPIAGDGRPGRLGADGSDD